MDVILFEKKDGFIFYKDWENIFFSLRTDKERSELLRAIFDLISRGKYTKFKADGLRVAYAVIVDTLCRDSKRWDEVCRKRSEAGKKGGRPKGKKQTKAKEAKKPNAFFDKQKNQTKAKKAKKADMVMDKDKDMDMVMDMERDIYNASQSEAPAPTETNQKCYGEYMHVMLSDIQYGKLIEAFGDKKTAEYIRRVDEYTQQTGKEYKDYYLTIRKWIREDEKRERESADPPKGEDASLDIAKIEQLMNDKYKKKAPDAVNIESAQKREN